METAHDINQDFGPRYTSELTVERWFHMIQYKNNSREDVEVIMYEVLLLAVRN